MTAVADLELPPFDYADAALAGARLHEELLALRERSWIARSPIGVVVLDREAVAFFLRSRRTTFPGILMLELLGVSTGPLHEGLRNNVINKNGEDHRRLRALVQPAFTPAAADRWRPAMRELLAELWAAAEDDGAWDAADVLGRPYPARMVATVIGAPRADADRLDAWSHEVQKQFDPAAVTSELPSLDRAAAEFQAYVRALVARRREDPGDDLVSLLLAAERDGDRLSEEECVWLVQDALNGGIDTTRSQLLHGLRLFAEHPEQWRRLEKDPALAAAAVEEVVRFEPAAPFTARIVTEDLEFRGISFAAGTVVFTCAVTANREGDGDAAPRRFDLLAERGREKPLTFGAGAHFCMGANLARAELQEAFAFLAPRMRDLALDGEPVYDTPTGIYGLRSLPVRFTPS